MKLTILIITSCLLQVSALTKAQINLKEKNASLESILMNIKQQTGTNFLYNIYTLKNANKVTVSFKNASLETALEKCFDGQPLTYEIKDKTVIVKEKTPSFLDRVVNRFANINVSGRVIDAENLPLIGASVSVKGKNTKSTSTNVRGEFYLEKVEQGAVLIFSFIGYLPKEVKASENMGDIMLEQSNSKLDEIQVIAYGTTTQRLSTGNVTTIKADVIEKQPVNNPLLALQGRVPGLFIEQATGFAGTGVKVRIQGQNSLSYGSDPLYIIDGIPYASQLLQGGNPILGNSGPGVDGNGAAGNPLSLINPSDIESISILKDADATAIYGSRAANGAILITTKKGQAGDTRVSFNLQSGWAKVPRKLDLMNSQQYLDMRRSGLKNDGIIAPDPGPYSDSDLNGNWDNSRYTDWQKLLIGGTAGYQDMNASVSGGSDRTVFLIGAGYHQETNVFPGEFADQKGSLHFNINNASLNQRFRIQFSGSYLFDNNKLPIIDLTKDAMSLAPVAPQLYQPDGNINWQPTVSGNTTFSNPMGQLYNQFFSKNTTLTSNLILSYEIFSELKLISSFGYNSIVGETTNKSYPKSTYPEGRPYKTRSTDFRNSNFNTWSIEPQLIYNRNINKGKLEVLLGATLNEERNKNLLIGAIGFPNDQVMDDLKSASNIQISSTLNSLYKYIAAFGRINYNWEDKYILNLTARRDGSSRFGPKRQFHNFSAIGGSWIFSKESLLQNHLSFLTFGKLRGSFGTTGSDQIPDYQFLSLYSPFSQSITYQGNLVYQPNGLTNPYLQWEETKKLQFGLDLGFLKDRLLLNTNYYRNYSSNQLSGYALPSTTGAGSILKNQNYKIQNSGWELSLSSINLREKNLGWSSIINFTLPKTLLVDYPDIVKSSAASTAIIGKPLTANYYYHFLGVDPATGKYQFSDKDGKPTFTPNYQDKIVIIDTAPKFYGGIQSTLSFKDVQLDFLFSFVKRTALNNIYFGNDVPGSFNGGRVNQPAFMSDNWKKPGDISRLQKFTTGYDLYQSGKDVYQSDAAFVNASYIRLKNVSLSWIIPDTWTKQVGFKKCNLFIQGQNILTITGYTGLDPETLSSFTLPPLRTVVAGVKVEL